MGAGGHGGRMTIDEFVAEVAGLDVKWCLRFGDAIRCEQGDCPIAAVWRKRAKASRSVNDGALLNDHWTECATDLGLSYAAANSIVGSADRAAGKIADAPSGANLSDPDVRAKLLAACKLNEIGSV